MPIFEYRCLECQSIYQILHKGREVTEDVVCPACGSPRSKKLISVASVSTHGSTAGCENEGGCCGGACQATPE